MAGFPKIRMIEGPDPGKETDLAALSFRIGRDADSDLVIGSPAVSRRHARIFHEYDLYRIEDLGSSNGTFVNGERLVEPRTLRDGDVIKLGTVIQLAFLASQPVAPGPAAVRPR